MEKTVILGVLIFIFGCSKQHNKTHVKFNDISQRGYSQSIEVNPRHFKTIYISGQVPVNPDGKLVGYNNLGLQTEQVFKNIKSQVEKAGGTMDDIVNLDCYFTDISKIGKFRTARDKFINLKNPPASTAVEINRLINKDFMIEINAVAVIKYN
ncbi:RidA family protein [Galbibacter pacificus]|uniref:RidA family protein n=1 Tax=Galbibacter pacificus TaxID=2996052 RepID=A0ABT6FN36_9FLAO|nr:RidA family protein [Galbibacter pacificus]MDG3581196.1 RidA family protein [Galbibacter pacificus]MDG3584674.1 RidA family protein [Galbibacter pacificus]